MCAKIVVQDIDSNTVHNSKNLKTTEISSKTGEQMNCGILITTEFYKTMKMNETITPHHYMNNIDYYSQLILMKCKSRRLYIL